MFTGTGSIHDLVIVVAYLAALFSGYAGMTVWERKGRQTRRRIFVGGLLGALGVDGPVIADPRAAKTMSRPK